MATQTRTRGLLTLIVEDAREYFRSDPGSGNRLMSQPVALCGLQWHLEAYRKVDGGVPHVGAFVYCSSDDDGPWKCKATCVLRVVNSLVDDAVQRMCEEFSDVADGWGFRDLLSVESMIKPASGVTAFMSPVSEIEQGARGTKRRCTDVKLIAEGRAVYANKGVLAVSCDYFEAMFYGDFDDRHKDEIALGEVKHDELVAFLKVINPPCAPIDENNNNEVLRLTDRFGAKIFVEKCEQVLVQDMKLKDAIVALDGCNILSDLKSQLLNNISKEDLKSLCEEETYKQLSPETALLVVKELKRHAFT